MFDIFIDILLKMNFEAVDVILSSNNSKLDSILEQPLLDGSRKYTVQCTEFVCPLLSESQLPPVDVFSEQALMYILKLRKRSPGVAPNHVNTLLRTYNAPNETRMNAFEEFSPSTKRSCNSPWDFVFELQYFFDNSLCVKLYILF